LDPAGIKWLRNFLRDFANQGRTVLVSSHLLSEVKQSVDDEIILRKGRMVQYGPLQTLIDAQGQPPVIIAGPSLDQLSAAIGQRGGEVRTLTQATNPPSSVTETRMEVMGLNRTEVGQLAHASQTQLFELSVDTSRSDLEQVFLALTDETAPQSGRASSTPAGQPPASNTEGAGS
jgi:ABC-2 type transport system ATP-binding protein